MNILGIVSYPLPTGYRVEVSDEGSPMKSATSTKSSMPVEGIILPCISEIIGIEKKGYLTVRLTITVEPPKKCHDKDIDKSHFFNSTFYMENLLLQPLKFDLQHKESCLKCPNLQIHIYFLSCTCHEMNKCLEHP